MLLLEIAPRKPGHARLPVRCDPESVRNLGIQLELRGSLLAPDLDVVFADAPRFEQLGHRLQPIAGGPPQLGRDWGLLGLFELAAHLHSLLPEHEDKFGRNFISGVKMGWQMSPEIWGQSAQQRIRLNDWCAELFERVDLLITPTVPYDPPPARGPFPEETEGRQQILAGVAAFTIPFNLSWHPAATVRVGLSRAGLPVGMQIVGPRHRDDLVLQAARAFERVRPWHPQWPVAW